VSVVRYDAELTVREGENGRTWARLQTPDLVGITQASVQEILLDVFDLEDVSEPAWRDRPVIAEHVYDTEQTQNWPGLGGYNFTAPVPSRRAPVEGGHNYLFRYNFRLRDDTSILWLVGCQVESVL